MSLLPHDGSPRTDGDLLFLTDSAYLSLIDSDTTPKRTPKGRQKQDGLFLERLDSFIEGQHKDMEAFAKREQRKTDEIRRLVAVPHATFLLSQDPTLPPSHDDPGAIEKPTGSNGPSIRSTLTNLSSTLQTLHNTAGLDSLLLVVSPSASPSINVSPSNGGSPGHSRLPGTTPEASWIGGTDLGKDFWMGLKGGGVNGAKSFRMKCQLRHEAELQAQDLEDSRSAIIPVLSQLGQPLSIDPPGTRVSKAKSGDVKTELNAAMRQALRSVSGNPSAEMRWTKPVSLEDSYDVRLVGWPPTVELRNPSNNSVKDNRLLLDLLRDGRMKFVKRGTRDWDLAGSVPRQTNHAPSDGTTHQGTPIWPTGRTPTTSITFNAQFDGAPRSSTFHPESTNTIQGFPRGHASPSRDDVLPLRVDPATKSHSRPCDTSTSVPLRSPQLAENSSQQLANDSESDFTKRHADASDEVLEAESGRSSKRTKFDGHAGAG